MEGKSFLSPSEKTSGAPGPIPGVESPKRGTTLSALAQPYSPLPVPAVHVAFRILCPAYLVGAVIGKYGNRIKKIRNSTKSNIWVEDAPHNSPDRVITVIAQAASTSRVKLGANNASYGQEEVEDEEIEVSNAQHALIRVFEVLYDGFGTGTVSCRLLMEASHVGAVDGKGGEMVERLRMETGCEVAIRTDCLPICADRDDAIVEIEGNVLAVKKALVSLSKRLQSCQQICKTRMVRYKSLDRDFQEALPRSSNVIHHDARHRETEVFPRGALHRYSEAVPHDALPRTMGVVSREALYGSSDVFLGDLSRQHREIYPRDSLHIHTEIGPKDALDRPLESFSRDAYQRRVDRSTQDIISRIEIPSRRGSALYTHPHSITASGSKNQHATIEQPPSELEYDVHKVVLKILCPTESAGGVIGPGGTNIKTLQSQTGASIDVGDTHANCDEFLITITSGVPEDRQSPAQRAIVLVFSRLFEIFTKTILDSGSRSFITARLVVPTNRIGCLRSFSLVEIGASILVLDEWEKPKCISANDRIVEISGEFPTVKEAILQVTRILRAPPSRRATYIPGMISIGGTTNPGSMGFPPSSSHSPTMSISLLRRSECSFHRRSHNPVNYSKPLDVDPYIRPEDPFPSRFGPTAGYTPDSGQNSTTEVDDICSLLSDRLRGLEDPFPTRFSPTDGYSPYFGQRSTMDVNDIRSAAPPQLRASPPPAAPRGAYDGSGGLSSTWADSGLGSGHKSSFVTDTTVEFCISESAAYYLYEAEYGQPQNRLEDLRLVSGARVIVHAPQPGRSDMIITISGTPDQTRIAEKLLHAFMRVGEALSQSFSSESSS